MSTRTLIALLSFIVVALLALVFLPYLMKKQTTELRRQLSEVSTPLSEHRNTFMRETAAESAAIRSYAFTGDETFLERYRSAHSEAEEAADWLREIASRLGDDQAVAAQDLLEARQEWSGPNVALADGELTREEFQERLSIQQQRYESLLSAERRLDRALMRTIQERRASIQQFEDRWALLTAGLALLSILAVGAALWLGRRLEKATRRVAEQAEGEAELFRITQLLNQAANLDGALRRVARGVADLADAQGAYVEKVDFDRDEVEVVSTIGRGAPPTGTTVPYPGSLAEEVINSGEPEVTTVDTIQAEGRAIADPLSRTCPGCQLLVVPLLSEDAALGALLLHRPPEADSFEAPEIARIRVLADMAALILRRLYLFEETRRREETLRERTKQLNELKATLEERVAARTEEVHRLASELTLSEQQERHRIATLLHDDLQQQLYGIRLDLGVLRRRMEVEAEKASSAESSDTSSSTRSFIERLSGAIKYMEELIETMRRRAIDLSPPILEGEGLTETFSWLGNLVEKRFGLEVSVENHSAQTVPQTGMRVLLFQIVRELLFHAAEHAGTNRVSIVLEEKTGDLVIEMISDGRAKEAVSQEDVRGEGAREDVAGNGAGFLPGEVFADVAAPEGPPPESASSEKAGRRIELARARDRLELFGGQIEMGTPFSEQGSGSGTHITITVPVQSLRREL